MADLLWSRRAIASLSSQDDWLRPKNPSAAGSILREIERSAGLLAEFPDMGRRIEGTSLRCHVTRRYRFRIVYRVVDGQVRLVDVMHPRRDKLDGIPAARVRRTTVKANEIDRRRSTAGRAG